MGTEPVYRKMNLQFFAEPASDPVTTPELEPKPKLKSDPAPQSFDDVPKNKDYQAEFDRRVQKRIDIALVKAQEKRWALTDGKLSEAEKLVEMTKEEEAQYFAQRQEKALAAREADITKCKLMAEAKNTLAEKKLPVGLVEVLDYMDAESCSKSIEAVEEVLREAVQAAVEEKSKGGTSPRKTSSGGGDDLEEQVEFLMMGV